MSFDWSDKTVIILTLVLFIDTILKSKGTKVDGSCLLGAFEI